MRLVAKSASKLPLERWQQEAASGTGDPPVQRLQLLVLLLALGSTGIEDVIELEYPVWKSPSFGMMQRLEKIWTWRAKALPVSDDTIFDWKGVGERVADERCPALPCEEEIWALKLLRAELGGVLELHLKMRDRLKR